MWEMNHTYRYKVIVRLMSSLDRLNCSASTGRLGARMTLDIGLNKPATLDITTIPHFCFFVKELKGLLDLSSPAVFVQDPSDEVTIVLSCCTAAASAGALVPKVSGCCGVRSRTVDVASDSEPES